ncbi:tetratricopeptide repeat protein [Aequorivita sp. SDUM287046]|uniref:Tetratricopeptide repeat protein n=1 Tax=Aequorivita aurantiaca TaxID=3053356 RepID=A0ABT8DFB5_9FLAO|nr:tetratricopeptide repeat protein [Aequorivita aurantiaca]MDN3724037.1 tetratricopeptide repeat protein [Aequorivita aurantiaca]
MDKNELIQKYFEKSLSPEEAAMFENLLADKEFADEVAFQKKIKKVITHEERATLKDKLRTFENQKTSTDKWWYAAASVFVLLGTAIWFMGQKPDYDTLYASYYETYPNVIAPVVRNNNDTITDTEKAFAYYEKQDYNKALEIFQTIIRTSPQEEYAQFYSAISYMELAKFSEASKILSGTNWSKKYADDAIWYLALLELKTDNPDASRKFLLEASKTSRYQKESLELLKKLD